jgi:hypothetical protein
LIARRAGAAKNVRHKVQPVVPLSIMRSREKHLEKRASAGMVQTYGSVYKDNEHLTTPRMDLAMDSKAGSLKARRIA